MRIQNIFPLSLPFSTNSLQTLQGYQAIAVQCRKGNTGIRFLVLVYLTLQTWGLRVNLSKQNDPSKATQLLLSPPGELQKGRKANIKQISLPKAKKSIYQTSVCTHISQYVQRTLNMKNVSIQGLVFQAVIKPPFETPTSSIRVPGFEPWLHS